MLEDVFFNHAFAIRLFGIATQFQSVFFRNNQLHYRIPQEIIGIASPIRR